MILQVPSQEKFSTFANLQVIHFFFFYILKAAEGKNQALN